MLVLTRKQGEVLHIGNNITITVVEMRNGRVRIGIDAPMEVAVRRGELELRDLAATESRDSNNPPSPEPSHERRQTIPMTCNWPRAVTGDSDSNLLAFP